MYGIVLREKARPQSTGVRQGAPLKILVVDEDLILPPPPNSALVPVAERTNPHSSEFEGNSPITCGNT